MSFTHTGPRPTSFNAWAGVQPAQDWKPPRSIQEQKPLRKSITLPNLREFNPNNPRCPISMSTNYSKELASGEISILFQDIEQRICAEISLMQTDGDFIFAAVAWLTSQPILEALIAARNRGVVVLVVVQKERWLRQNREGSYFDNQNRKRYNELGGYNTFEELELLLGSFYRPGINWNFNDHQLKAKCEGWDVSAVRCLGVEAEWTGRMHHKFMVFGHMRDFPLASKVLTGSYNFSSAAAAGLENVIIINRHEAANAYAREFAMIFLHSEPLDWVNPQMNPTFTCDPPVTPQ